MHRQNLSAIQLKSTLRNSVELFFGMRSLFAKNRLSFWYFFFGDTKKKYARVRHSRPYLYINKNLSSDTDSIDPVFILFLSPKP